MDEGSRTFTMRELLNGLNNDDTANESSSPYSYSEGTPRQQQKQQQEQNNDAMELINSVTGTDDDGRSRQRVLTFAAKRYASAIERNPDDYDALYNWALVLQKRYLYFAKRTVTGDMEDNEHEEDGMRRKEIVVLRNMIAQSLMDACSCNQL